MVTTDTDSGENRPGSARSLGYWLAGILGVFFLLGGLMYFLDPAPSPGAGGQGGTAGEAGAGRSGTAFTGGEAEAGGMVRVRVYLRVFGEDGKESPVGTVLPRRISLVLTGGDKREYVAPLDRAGIWEVEVPPGSYRILRKQEKMGEWKWSLKGKGLSLDREKDEYRLVVEPGAQLRYLDLSLY